MSTVKLPAEAEAYKVQTIAEGKRTQTVESARAEAERVSTLIFFSPYQILGFLTSSTGFFIDGRFSHFGFFKT